MENLELGTVDKSKSMSEILKEALEAKGYSQRSFAKKLGYTPQNFSQRLKRILSRQRSGGVWHMNWDMK